MDADVAVVGSGVAGALVAWRLASAGARVVILEAGTRVDRATALRHFQSSPDRALDSPYPDSARVGAPSAKDLGQHYVQEGPEFVSGLYLRAVGGSTWHWLGTAMRLHPHDFRMRSRYGVGVDWPLAYQDLEPWYLQAERALGVAGEDDWGSPRSGPYPMPPHPASGADFAVSRAGAPLKLLPQARNSRVYEGRAACCGAASCVPICPVGAKYDASVHVAAALRAGARLLEATAVQRLEPGWRVHWKRRDGSSGVLTAGRVVVAAHAVETPRLLLHSGLGGPAVGRYLMAGNAVLSTALAAEPVHPYGAPQATSGLDLRDGPWRGERSGFLLAVSNDGWPDGSPDRLAGRLIRRGLAGRALQEAIRDHVLRQVALVSTCEDLPLAENRVDLAPDAPDAFGMPRPRLRYRLSDWTRRGQAEAQAVHARLLEAMGAAEIAHSTAADPGYLLGTCRMGEDPGESVVDPDLEGHGLRGLHLVGSMVFPTAGSSPPTLTVAALALRLAARLTGACARRPGPAGAAPG